MAFEKIIVPKNGEQITLNQDNSLNVPDHPIVPFIEGDGIGVDVTPAMLKVVDAAVSKSYEGRAIGWKSMPVKRRLKPMVTMCGCLKKHYPRCESI